MPHSRQEDSTNPSRPGAAWRAAAEAGVDMSLLEHSLSLTVSERLVEHQRALELAETLQKAKIKPCQT